MNCTLIVRQHLTIGHAVFYMSPELVESARVKCSALNRLDHENYSSANNIEWKDNDTLKFEGNYSKMWKVDRKPGMLSYFQEKKGVEKMIFEPRH